MIEFAVCMGRRKAKVGAKLGNERKSNNGVTNEIEMREVRAQARGKRRSFYLQLRVHVLPRMLRRHESRLPQLRRRISQAAEEEAGLASAVATALCRRQNAHLRRQSAVATTTLISADA